MIRVHNAVKMLVYFIYRLQSSKVMAMSFKKVTFYMYVYLIIVIVGIFSSISSSKEIFCCGSCIIKSANSSFSLKFDAWGYNLMQMEFFETLDALELQNVCTKPRQWKKYYFKEFLEKSAKTFIVLVWIEYTYLDIWEFRCSWVTKRLRKAAIKKYFNEFLEKSAKT